MASIKNEWGMIRREFFPRWDRRGEWKCRVVADVNGSQGYCFSEHKVIKLCRHLIGGDREGVQLLLIHEICHAVTPLGHGAKWLARMATAAKRAKAIGMKSLATRLRDEAREYEATPRETASMVYQRMKDVVWDCKEISFNDAVVGVSREYGMDRREFLSRYRRLQSVYEKTVREKAQHERLREQFRKRPIPATAHEPEKR